NDDFFGPFFDKFLSNVDYDAPGYFGLVSSTKNYFRPPEALKVIVAKSLVVGFSDDLTMPAKLCREVHEAIPDSLYVEFGGTGHLGPFLRQESVLPVVMDFMST